MLMRLCDRQYLEEEKSRRKVSAEHAPLLDDDNSDAASTKDGVLHEEGFHQTREPAAGDGVHDVEAPVVSEDQGLLSTLKIVNWWQVCAPCSICKSYVSLLSFANVATFLLSTSQLEHVQTAVLHG